ncbi:hypothetical protein KPATCC21470_1023 [Kitasatospora purpeofusca]
MHRPGSTGPVVAGVAGGPGSRGRRRVVQRRERQVASRPSDTGPALPVGAAISVLRHCADSPVPRQRAYMCDGQPSDRCWPPSLSPPRAVDGGKLVNGRSGTSCSTRSVYCSR